MANTIQMRENGLGLRVLRHLLEQKIDLPNDYLRQALQALAQGLMDAEVSRQIAAARYERRATRQTYRNGYRATRWQTRFGVVTVRVPKLRRGTYTPQFLEEHGSDWVLAALAVAAFFRLPSVQAIQAVAGQVGCELTLAQSAALQAVLHDLAQRCQATLSQRDLMFDQLRVRLHARDYDLALAIAPTQAGQREVIAHELTRQADQLFWQAFIRRIDPAAQQTVQYVNNSNVYHILRLTKTDMPQMALAA